jgi:hypothetical protein
MGAKKYNALNLFIWNRSELVQNFTFPVTTDEKILMAIASQVHPLFPHIGSLNTSVPSSLQQLRQHLLPISPPVITLLLCTQDQIKQLLDEILI